jgi:tetratricopeptide (TPR) repeat protein
MEQMPSFQNRQSPRKLKGIDMKLLTLIMVAIATITHACAAARGQAANSEVTPEVEKALLADNWAKVADLLATVDTSTPSPVLRLLKGHACLALNKNNESVRLLKDTGKSEDDNQWQAWTGVFSASHPSRPIAAYLKGDALARQQKHEQAIAAFTAGLREHPNHALLLNARAVCYASLGKWNEAIVDLDDAAKVNPKLAEVHANRGSLSVRRSLGAPGALAAFNRSLEISPDFVLAKIGKASALYGLGKWTEAREFLEECKSDPDSGHLAAINAALVREAACNTELAAIDGKTAGVAIERVARDQQQRLDTVNKDILRNDMGRIANTFVADTFRDLRTTVKPVADVFQGVIDFRKGNVAGGVGKIVGAADDAIGKPAQIRAEQYSLKSQQSAQSWSKGIGELQSLRSSGLQGGVSTEDIRRGYLDKGNWRLLARFALQYPEPEEGDQTASQPQAGR